MSAAACEPGGKRHPAGGPNPKAAPDPISTKPCPDCTFQNTAGGSKDFSKVAEK
jgi:hypothetical protein